ncbi:MAG: hypothetical protein AAGC70_01730 [Pseudomonadota bacterium]
MVIVAVIVGLIVAAIAVVILTPRIVEYVETIVIDAPASRVHDAIRYQRDLMRWSAWPSETGSECSVEGTDGNIGAQTIFLDKKGNRFGYQEVTAIQDKAVVRFKLESKGPPHEPTVDIYTVSMEKALTTVVLHFRNDIAPPFHILLRLFGVVRWTREMHRKDLDGLKRFVEKREDYRGKEIPDAA